MSHQIIFSINPLISFDVALTAVATSPAALSISLDANYSRNVTVYNSFLESVVDLTKLIVEEAGSAAQTLLAEMKSEIRSYRIADGELINGSTTIPVKEIGNTAKNLEQLLAELDALIGLASVKKEVHSLVNLIRLRELRRQGGLPSPKWHCTSSSQEILAPEKRRLLVCFPKSAVLSGLEAWAPRGGRPI